MTPEAAASKEQNWASAFAGQAAGLVASAEYFRIRRLEFELQRMLAPAFFLPAPRRVLELGCGIGYKSLLWRQLSPQVEGIDLPEVYHGFAAKEPGPVAGQRILDSLGVSGVRLGLGDFHEHLAANAEGYDCIFSDYLFEHVPDLPRMCRSIASALAPGGRTVHIVPTTQAAFLELARANLEPRLRDVLEVMKNYAKRWIRGERRHARFTLGGLIVPMTHSEYTSSYVEQLDIYHLENYLFPLMEAGLRIQMVLPIRETSVAIYAAKEPGAEA